MLLRTIANLPAITTKDVISIPSLVANWGIKKQVVLGLMEKYALTTNQVEIVLHLVREYESVRSIVAGLVRTHQDMGTVEKILDINRQIGMPIKDVSKLAEKFDVDELQCIAEFIDELFADIEDWPLRHQFCKIIMRISRSDSMVFADAILEEAKRRWLGSGDDEQLEEDA